MGQRSVYLSIMKADQEDFVVDNPALKLSDEELKEPEAWDASASELVSEVNYSSHLTRCRCVWCFLGYYPRFCCGGGMSCCIIFTGALE